MFRLFLWNREIFSAIARGLGGELRDLDAETITMSRANYARLKVDVPWSFTPKPRVEVEMEDGGLVSY